ncbi:MAG TPA: hypothetical protein VKB05_19210 [Pyrinomonadaceae bacterium]|nr:hypothetical protein [Pyrinomonadaceae bacterium]
MKKTVVSVGLVLALMSMGVMMPSRTHAATPTPAVTIAQGLQIPVNFTSPNGTFTGIFSLSRFVLQNGQVAAVGTLTGTVTNSTGQTVGAIARNLTLSLITINATCDILHLELGPIDLNLLGLVVHVDKIVIDIDAQSGPGNLLGNLLCAVANLLNTNGPLSTLVNLLNQILASL